MANLILTTLNWVPIASRGYVRDLRIRWALEEAGLAYQVNSVSFRDKNFEGFSHQPFGQVPWLSDGNISIFESGAILLYLAERSTVLMPDDINGRYEVIEWVFAALNSIESASLPWSLFKLTKDTTNTPGRIRLEVHLQDRLKHLENILITRKWLGRDFSIADILMVDVLRNIERFEGLKEFPACQAYVSRATARPHFLKAHADQIRHFETVDIVSLK